MVEEQEGHKEYSRNKTNNKMGKGKQKTNKKGGRRQKTTYVRKRSTDYKKRGRKEREQPHRTDILG